ncbi:FYVE, RhoGEF and PH domain-containing protein 4-like isoform X2 [Dendronephthya gigantea]|uniref:FYVE, RhoGEF and PH domain-containing protein 4-like isoform X2 n=1 Tax=Dendronephthya gigantea TaxID=151771 RepID=UPI00106D9EC4|nr:FYVE, RhoGEF and PH domain-containing protein 4-like isoform X2 [Dendronephthya gigantea]
MQKGSSTGNLPASNNDLTPPAKPVQTPDKPDVETDHQDQNSNQTCKTPKPAVPPKPILAKNGKHKGFSCDSSPPDIAPKPVKKRDSEEQCGKLRSNHEQDFYQNGDQDQTDEVIIREKTGLGDDAKMGGGEEGLEDQSEQVLVIEEKIGIDLDDEIEGGNDENGQETVEVDVDDNVEANEDGDEEDDEEVDDEDYGWDSDEFESENDSDDHDNNLADKRQSRIIFDELEHIPDLNFLDARKKKLFNIAKEILTTEVTYVKTLKLLDEVFHFRLENECRAKGIVPKEVLLEIFSNITAINQFHRDFLLPKLDERMQNWDTNPRVGDIFNSLAPFLKMYAEYVKNFDQAMSSLSRWKLKSQKFSAIIDQIQKTDKECNNLTLEHHMLAPVQRVPRYKLLLTDYISKLPEDSKDLEESKKALEIISAAANHANDSMKKTERFQKMLEMQEKFGDGVSIVTPSREFIMEGELIKISARNAQIMTRILVLFNDALYYCTKVPTTGKYKAKQTLELLSTYLGDVDEETENRELVFRVCSKSKVVEFKATSVEQKEKWVSTLTAAIKNAVDRNSTFGREVTLNKDDIGKIAPTWVRDDAVTMCMTCTIHFTAIRRRHHCRACGKIVCNSCSSYKARLEYDDNKINRVCVNCYKILAPEETNKPEIKRRRRKVQKFADSVLNGYLNFKSDSTKAWSKRWCRLGDDFTLHVFKAKKDVKAQTTIPMPGLSLQDENVCDENDKSRKHVFKILHPIYGSFFFEAENDEVLEKWLEHIRCAIEAEPYPNRNSTSSQPTPPPTPG